MQETMIPTGFRTLDALLGGGLRPGTLTLVGSRPGMGKTTFIRRIEEQTGTPRGMLSFDRSKGSFPWVFEQMSHSPAKIVFIDDLTYYEGSLAGKARLLRDSAKKLNIAVVAAVKLPRSLEKREDAHPILSDFRAGPFGLFGAERYADNVIALYRASYYDPLAEWDAPDGASNAEAIVLKSAGGATGTVRMIFDGKAKIWREAQEQ